MRRYWRDPSFQIAARSMISEDGYDAVKVARELMTDDANKSAYRYLVDLGKAGIPIQAADGTQVIRKIDFEKAENVVAYFETTIPGRIKTLVGDNEKLLGAIAHGRLGEVEQTVDNKALKVLNRVVSEHEVGGFGSGKTRPGWVGSEVYHPEYGRGVVTAEAANGQSMVTFNGSAWAGGKPTPGLRAAIEEWRVHPSSPLRTKRPINYVQASTAKTAAGRSVAESWNAATDLFFNQLWGGTTDKLSRSPAFRQYYYAKVADLMPYLDPTEANKVIKTMEAAGAGKFLAPDVLDRVVEGARKANGKFTAAELDGYAKDHALGKVKALLYDSSEKSQLADSLRLVFPFAEAWKEVLQRQAKLIADNPGILHTVQKGITAGQQAGMMREDANGRWVFAYPGSPAVIRALTGQDGAMLAQVSGLNIANGVMPGVGPVMQIGMSKILPDVPEYDWVRDIITPYGEKGLVDAFTPSWMAKVYAGMDGDETGQTAYATQLSEVIRVLASSGKYGNDLAESERMIDDAKSQARWLTVFRGLSQAVVPSAPFYDFKIAGKVDAWSSAFAQEYGKLYDEDPTTATERFLNLYGDMAAAYVIGKTKATVEGVPFDATKDFTDWQRRNPGLIRSYPDIANYFAPTTGTADDTAFQRQLDDGTRVRRSPEEQTQAVNSVIAKKRLDEYTAPINKAVDDLVASLPPSNKRSPEQQQALNETRNQAKLAIAAYKTKLEGEYHGFEASPKIEIGFVQNQLGTLRQALGDDRLADNPTSKVAAEYLKVRDSAVNTLAELGRTKDNLGGGLLAQGHEDVAALVRQAGEYYAKQDEGFARMWDDFLSKEVTE
jgi:hypothetical protein